MSTDYIEFSVEFLNKEKDTDPDHLTSDLTFRYDMFKCKVYADVFASGYWAQEAEDWNIRYDTDTAANVYALDDAPTEALLGQDWFIFAEDVDMRKNLCDENADSTYACSRIRCITRREMSPTDSNDLGFSPTSITDTNAWDYMHIPAGAAKLYINMQDTDDAYKLYLTN